MFTFGKQPVINKNEKHEIHRDTVSRYLLASGEISNGIYAKAAYRH
jgi:hypothetical protein